MKQIEQIIEKKEHTEIYRPLFEKIKFRMHYPDRKIESRKFFSKITS